MNRRPLILLTIFLAGCGSSPSGCSGGGSRSVVVEPIKMEIASPTISVQGTLTPNRQSDIQFAQSTRIKSVHVAMGDVVNEGDPIIDLSEETLSHELNVLKAKLKEAQALLDKNDSLLKNRDALLQASTITEMQHSNLPVEVAANTSTMERLKSEMSLLESRLKELQIRAPIKGDVVSVTATPGSSYTSGTILARIIDTDPMLVSFPLPAEDAMSATIGTEITVYIDDIPNESRNGTITFISPELHHQSKTFMVWASVSNGDRALKIGMSASAEFMSATEHRVARIPKSALMVNGRRGHVFIVENGVARKREIHFKESDHSTVLVSQGVIEGELIVTKGIGEIQDGMFLDVRR